MEYLPRGVGSLPGLNGRIDDAAEAAGRSPRDVRRLMNFMNVRFSPTGRGLLDGPVDQWVEQLSSLALEHGVTAYLMEITTIGIVGAG